MSECEHDWVKVDTEWVSRDGIDERLYWELVAKLGYPRALSLNEKRNKISLNKWVCLKCEAFSDDKDVLEEARTDLYGADRSKKEQQRRRQERADEIYRRIRNE